MWKLFTGGRLLLDAPEGQERQIPEYVTVPKAERFTSDELDTLALTGILV